MSKVEQTKRLIVTKASALFNTKGYNATSLSDITIATQMTKGAIYGNFGNKDEVAIASFEYAASLILNQISDRIKAAPTAPLKLKAILNYYSDYVENPPIQGGCPIINTAIESDDQYPLLRQKTVETIQLIKISLQKIIERGVAEKQIREGIDAELYTNMFYASIMGAIVLARVEGKQYSLAQVTNGLERQIDAISI